MVVAITRAVSDSLGACELTHLERVPIDLALARAQHQRYEAALERAGCFLVSLPQLRECPDAVFVEDVALVLDGLAVLTRPGAPSRRREVSAMAQVLGAHRPLRWIEEPGTLDGGDVLRLGRRIYVGLSGRSNEAAVEQLRALTAGFGYTVEGVPVTGCLHLKSAVTEVAPGTILVNPKWVDPAVFGAVDVVAVDPAEPHAANALLIAGPETPGRSGAEAPHHIPSQVAQGFSPAIYPTSFPRTRRLLESRGIPLDVIDVSELQKAEGAVTCCSLVFRA